ncbi:MAG: choice-of-anchor Q domain-containing protein [Dokdonella sp.]|uniref:choice-of-anchor Q domain-containing protein n=1 Tax=Dokdonella sp. TaxID=2291710 RepID=UPI003F80A9DB
MRLVHLLLPAIALAFASAASAAPLTVGDGCQYSQLQAAIDATHGTTNEIHIRANYHGKPVRISNKRLYIWGGYANCNDAQPIPYTGNPDDLSFLDGALDGSDKPVIVIDGRANVNLRNILVMNAHNAGNKGGAIGFVSSGDESSLFTESVVLLGNVAGYGGGIYFRGAATSSRLTLGRYTLIQSNRAMHTGGGLQLEGNVHLVANDEGTIADNTARNDVADFDSGGGLQLEDDVVADIGSPGINGLPFLDRNHSFNGAGVAMKDAARANLYSTVAGAPLRIAYNDAANEGGALWLDGNDVRLCMAGVRVHDNLAADGPMLRATSSLGRNASIAIGTDCGIPGEVACQPGAACNLFDGNAASWSEGRLFRTQGAAPTVISHARFANNAGGYLMELATAAGASVNVTTSAMVHNRLAYGVLNLGGSDVATIRSSTIAGNSVGARFADAPEPPLPSALSQQTIFMENGVQAYFTGTILWQPGTSPFERAGTAAKANLYDVVVNGPEILNPTYFSAFVRVSGSDPQFVDPQLAWDLHLRPTSPAIDAAPAESCPEAVDLDGLARPLDMPQVAGIGPCDIGAYEVQSIPQEPPIFANGFD